jgi:DNA mismatch repair protein MutL
MINTDPSIQLLSPLLTKQIAAGEVIERPASVVKELVENSLDAGATEIYIDLEQGGIDLIRVRDNGHGIRAQELTLALSAHATSKIRELADLHHIQTLGFRGEALASMASVSRLTLTSRFYKENQGATIQINGNENQTVRVAAHPVGTCVEVRNLFYNTPARRKYLKSARTEFNHIQELVKRVALSHFELKIQLQHNQKRVLSLNAYRDGDNKLHRLSQLCPAQFAQHSVRISQNLDDLQLHGWISQPLFYRAQADMQYFFVNGRMVRDKLLNQAVRQAYKPLLNAGRYPVYVLYLQLPFDALDVNVHPAKQEVRFVEGQKIYDMVYHSLQRGLQPIETTAITPKYPVGKKSPSQALQIRELLAHYQKLQQTPPLPVPASSATFGTALAQLKNRYILAENQQGLLLIDSQSAQQYLIYQQLKQAYQTTGVGKQTLLIPLTLALEPQQMAVIPQQQQRLATLGFNLQVLSSTAVKLLQLPSLLAKTDISQLLADVLYHLTHSATDGDDLPILAHMARHNRLDEPLTLAQMNALLHDLAQNQACDDKGNWLWIELSMDYLATLFLRS